MRHVPLPAQCTRVPVKACNTVVVCARACVTAESDSPTYHDGDGGARAKGSPVMVLMPLRPGEMSTALAILVGLTGSWCPSPRGVTTRELIRDSATSIKRFSLALGGNAPVIVTRNTDVAAAATACMLGKFGNCGQVCVSAQRVFVERCVHDEFVATARKLAEEAIALGNGTEYGLYAYGWTRDIVEANTIDRGLRFGSVVINGGGWGIQVPHGGIKESGVGQDGSKYGLDEYYYVKSIRMSVV